MGRPRYETKEQREHQDKIRDLLCQVWGLRLIDVSETKYMVDWAIVQGQRGWGDLKGFSEFKARAANHDTYATIMMSAQKYMAGIKYRIQFNINFVFVVHFWDGLYSYRCHGQEQLLQYGGRSQQTRDADDVEPVVLLPADEFKFILGPDKLPPHPNPKGVKHERQTGFAV